MSEITLPGLVGTHPLGALAALGLLRCCEDMATVGPARLSWNKEAGWVAVLHTGHPVSADELVAALVARQRDLSARPELNWADNIKTNPATFAAAAKEAVGGARPDHRDFADFLAAFGCELVMTGRGDLEPTAFYMTSGQQKFLKEVRNLCGRLASGLSIGRRKKGPEEAFREALLGPWRYEDPQHSLGWDPTTERLHALRAKSPTKEASAGVAAAVWLAFEALPFFPCFLSGGRLSTRGFSRVGDAVVFSWPVWTQPMAIAALRTLLGLKELTTENPPLAELRERGVAAVFRSERYKVKTQGAHFILRPAFACSG
jgi:hypothetical protein